MEDAPRPKDAADPAAAAVPLAGVRRDLHGRSGPSASSSGRRTASTTRSPTRWAWSRSRSSTCSSRSRRRTRNGRSSAASCSKTRAPEDLGAVPADDLPGDDVRSAPAGPRHRRADLEQWAICGIVAGARSSSSPEVRKVVRVGGAAARVPRLHRPPARQRPEPMAVIIPRWEWRTFGQQFGAAEAAFAAMTLDRRSTTATRSTCWSRATGSPTDVVKIRVRPHGREGRCARCPPSDSSAGSPILKVGFPIAGAPTSSGCAKRSTCPPPTLARDGYTLEQFLDEVAGPSGAVRAVKVHKHRVRYTVGGCSASSPTSSPTAGRPGRSPSSRTDAAGGRRGRRSVGLDGYVNTSYPRGLVALLEDRPPTLRGDRRRHELGQVPRRPSTGRRGAGGRSSTAPSVTRLGEGLDATESRSPRRRWSGPSRRSAAWSTRRRTAARVRIAAVGTAGLRAAGNRDAVLAAIRARTGLTVEVIPGEEEGRLAYLAVQTGIVSADARLAVFDTGGGSSQFTFGRGGHVDEQFSVPVGAVRYTERFGLAGVVTPAVLDEARAAIAADLVQHRRPPGARRPGRDGRRRHEHHGGEARARRLRPRCRPGHGPRSGRDRSPDRALSIP